MALGLLLRPLGMVPGVSVGDPSLPSPCERMECPDRVLREAPRPLPCYGRARRRRAHSGRAPPGSTGIEKTAPISRNNSSNPSRFQPRFGDHSRRRSGGPTVPRTPTIRPDESRRSRRARLRRSGFIRMFGFMCCVIFTATTCGSRAARIAAILASNWICLFLFRASSPPDFDPVLSVWVFSTAPYALRQSSGTARR